MKHKFGGSIFQKIGQLLLSGIPIIGVILLGIGILMTYKGIPLYIAGKLYSGGIVALLSGLILIGISLATLKPGRSIYNIPMIMVFSIILFLAYCFLFGDKIKIVTKPEVMKYDIFKDLLIIILSVAAIMIALISFLSFRLLKRDVEKRVDDLTHEVYFKSIARILSCIGYMCWSNYKIDPFQNNEKKEHFLSYAIRFTDDALHKYGIELDKESRENEELIYLIKNNLAFYFAECYRFEMRVLGKDLKEIRTLAIDYADEIKKKIRRFPARAGSWIHTCEYVKRYCEDCNT